jgi:hypothetical protein
MISSTTENLIPPRLRWLVRGVWVGLALLLAGIYVVGFVPRYRELNQICSGENCPVLILNEVEAALLQSMGLTLQFYTVVQMSWDIYLAFVFTSLAGLIFWRRSDTWIGIFISLVLLFLGLFIFVDEPRALVRLYPHFQPVLDYLTSLAIGLFMLMVYLFPDGRFAPRWLGWPAAFMIGVMFLDPILIKSEARASSGSLLVVVSGMSGALVGLLSQIYRYRKISDALQRQQTKWVVLGLCFMFATMMVWVVFGEVFPLEHGPARLAFGFSLLPQSLLTSLFPIAMVFSILRYRLWDIDLIIRRTLQYALLTGFLSLVYIGGVTVLQALLSTVGTQSSTATIVLTTLAIAALFNPLRRRIQDFIDRRFYRQKYNAEQALAQFAEAARNETDLSRLSSRLIATVVEALQPEHSSVWLKPGWRK